VSTQAILVLVIVIVLIFSWPSWPYSRDWGYGPTGILGTILIVILILWLVRQL
jgi:hypothetical protein